VIVVTREPLDHDRDHDHDHDRRWSSSLGMSECPSSGQLPQTMMGLYKGIGVYAKAIASGSWRFNRSCEGGFLGMTVSLMTSTKKLAAPAARP
jgi:hypothetical protein